MYMDIVGTSRLLRHVIAQIERVGPTDSTVLVTGETGVGKELVAHAVHRSSRRAARPLIKVSCASLPATLIASELFGHERGAFTGASERRIGRFELASEGSIFLDEVGELPPEIQVSLLRVLQEKEFERVGGNHTIRTNARVIAATNRDLKSAVAEGRFRGDLYYRLNVFPIEVPPLRSRREDIPKLVEHFAALHGARLGKKFLGIPKATMERLVAYDWPGNVRECANVIERAAILSDGPQLEVDERLFVRESSTPSGVWSDGKNPVSNDSVLRQSERELIERALAECRGRISGPSGAARQLGIPASTLESKIRSLGIDKLRYRSAGSRS
jgi:formate hydrogenlyase transcriptional activator